MDAGGAAGGQRELSSACTAGWQGEVARSGRAEDTSSVQEAVVVAMSCLGCVRLPGLCPEAGDLCHGPGACWHATIGSYKMGPGQVNIGGTHCSLGQTTGVIPIHCRNFQEMTPPLLTQLVDRKTKTVGPYGT